MQIRAASRRRRRRHLLIRRIRAQVAVVGAAWRAAQSWTIRFGVASGVRCVLIRRVVTVSATDPQVLMVMVMIVVVMMVMMMLHLTWRHWC